MISAQRVSESTLPPLTWMHSPSLEALRPPIGNKNAEHWRRSVPAVASHPRIELAVPSPREMKSLPDVPSSASILPTMTNPMTSDKPVPALPLDYDDMIQHLPVAQTQNTQGEHLSIPVDSMSTFDKFAADTKAELLFDCAPIAPPLDRHAEYLGEDSEERAAVRYHYFERFDLSHQRVDNALRSVCTKLLLRGETQRLDRVLAAFAKRYIECNPQSVLRNQDTTHTVAFSLFLLNTDLHLAGMQTRMTRTQFVTNTLASLVEHPEGSVSPVTPLSSPGLVRSASSHDLGNHARSSSRTGVTQKLVRHLSIVSRRETDICLDNERGPLQDLLRDMYFSIRHEPIPMPASCPPSGTTISPCHAQEGQTTWRDPLLESPTLHSPVIEGALYLREYIPNRLTRRKPWLPVRGVVSNAILHLIKNDSQNRSPHRSFGLQHAIATMPERQDNIFQLVLASGEVYVMRTPSAPATQQWIQACNYWAARTSKPRLQSGTTNLDYGWKNVCPEARVDSRDGVHPVSRLSAGGAARRAENPTWSVSRAVTRVLRLHSRNDAGVTVGHWLEPSAPQAQSTLAPAEQAVETTRCLASLRDELQQHDALYVPMQVYWAVQPNSRARAMSNWERKRVYLEHELIKYAQYAAVLQDA